MNLHSRLLVPKLSGAAEYLKENIMESAVIFWVYIGIMEKKMETTIVHF